MTKDKEKIKTCCLGYRLGQVINEDRFIVPEFLWKTRQVHSTCESSCLFNFGQYTIEEIDELNKKWISDISTLNDEFRSKGCLIVPISLSKKEAKEWLDTFRVELFLDG